MVATDTKPEKSTRAPKAEKATASNSKTPKKPMTAAHKTALAEGREQGRLVRDYLEALTTHRPKRGRKVTTESLTTRLEAIKEKITTASPADRLLLVQARMDVEQKLAAAEDTFDMQAVEQGFVKSAKGYAERKHISYDAFRELQVPPALLKEAGIVKTA